MRLRSGEPVGPARRLRPGGAAATGRWVPSGRVRYLAAGVGMVLVFDAGWLSYSVGRRGGAPTVAGTVAGKGARPVAGSAAVPSWHTAPHDPGGATVPAVTAASRYGLPSGLGVVGPYADRDMTALVAAGVSQTLVEVSWAQAEPAPGVFDRTYLAGVSAQVARLRSAGFQVALNTGLYEAPGWLLALPGARYVDQHGDAYTAEPLPNLVFGTDLRPLAQAYLDELFAVLGTDFSLVRAGGGHYGELGYPFVRAASGVVEPNYYGFGGVGAATNPVPGWRPGEPSPHGQAAAFLTWYLGALTDYQDWQVTALRVAGYTGRVAMLYPSYGMGPGDAAAAVAGNLSGSTAAERGGQVQAGFDWADQIAALPAGTVVYGTWGERLDAMRKLAALAQTRGLPVMAENSGGNSTAELEAALAQARRLGFAAFWLVRAGDVLSPAPDQPNQLRAIGADARSGPTATG